MPDYRRLWVPGGTYFLTLATHQRRHRFVDESAVGRLRAALRAVAVERPFRVDAAVVLPDHLHFLWTLPAGDGDLSTRVGRMKALFTRSLGGEAASAVDSRRRHRERDVWQRRYWDHLIRDRDDWDQHLDYVHFNPVKHGHATCPHAWPWSSFPKWVARNRYAADWKCACGKTTPVESPTSRQGIGGE